MFKRQPDFIIGEADNPYMLRWWVIPRNRFFNIYLHKILRSDDDRALHDHPWWNVSFLLKGGYLEVMPYFSGIRGHISADLPYGQRRKIRRRFSFVFRRAEAAHRRELIEAAPCWSLFITGPKIREWGFYCPKRWRHWKDFVAITPGGNEIGKGCAESRPGEP